MHLLILQLYQELVEEAEQLTITLKDHPLHTMLCTQMGADLEEAVTILTHLVWLGQTAVITAVQVLDQILTQKVEEAVMALSVKMLLDHQIVVVAETAEQEVQTQ